MYRLCIVTALALFLAACASTAPVAAVPVLPAEQSAQVNFTTDQSAYSRLKVETIQPNHGIIDAIVFNCRCDFREYSNLGVIVARSNEQVLYVKNIRALRHMGALEEDLLFSVQPGDLIYFGKVRDVEDAALAGILTVEGEYDKKSRTDKLQVFGSDLVFPITAELAPERNEWVYFGGGHMFASITDAVRTSLRP